MGSEAKSPELVLAEAVAERTAQRVRAGLREELEARDTALCERLRGDWQRDLAELRDDLTTAKLLAGVSNQVGKGSGEPARVLVVDDFPPLRRALVKILTGAGMLVRDAENGLDAANILENDRMLEVVIADISMPKNGYTLLEHVRKCFPAVEVVLTSGYELEHGRARELGAFGFLPKPFDVTMAVMLVERAAELRRLKLAKG